MRAIVLRSAATLLAVATLVGSTVALAAETPQPRPRRQTWEEHLQKHLGLTDQQVQAIQEIRARDAEARKAHWQQMRTLRAELNRLVLIEADQASITAKLEEVQQLVAAGVERRVKMLQAITPLLTPEQREALAQLAEKRGHYHYHKPRPQPS